MKDKSSPYILILEIVLICIFHTVKIINSENHSSSDSKFKFSFIKSHHSLNKIKGSSIQ
jgi:hypothetical protein